MQSPISNPQSAIQPWPGPADVEYFTQAQAGAWGETLAAFARFLALLPGAAVLDAGTGPGLLVRSLADSGARPAVGCDASLDMARRAAELAGRDPSGPLWLAADARQLPFAAGAFDAVLATNLLFLLPDPAAGIAALARVTRPGGTVAFLNPTDTMSMAAAEAFMDGRGIGGFARFSFVNYARLAEAHQRLTVAQWIALAEAAGLRDVQTETRARGMMAFVKGQRMGAADGNG